MKHESKSGKRRRTERQNARGHYKDVPFLRKTGNGVEVLIGTCPVVISRNSLNLLVLNQWGWGGGDQFIIVSPRHAEELCRSLIRVAAREVAKLTLVGSGIWIYLNGLECVVIRQHDVIGCQFIMVSPCCVRELCSLLRVSAAKAIEYERRLKVMGSGHE